MSGRQQYVRIGAEVSSLGTISHDVPKGSILGPALFAIYMNNLPNILKFGSLESDFDESRLYLSFSVKDTCSVVQQIKYDNLSRIAYWCCYNSLLINPDKTKLVVLGTRQMLQRLPADFPVSLLMERKLLQPPLYKTWDLVDSTLSFDEHITNTVLSCLGSLGQINRMRQPSQHQDIGECYK